MSIAFNIIKFLLLMTRAELTKQYCYELKLLSFRTTDTASYRFAMYKHETNSLSSVTKVLEQVPIPMWNLILIQHTIKHKGVKSYEAIKTLYNATYKVCEFWSYIKRARIIHNVAQVLFTQSGGNMSMACPLNTGTYVFNNIQVPPDTGFLKFIYSPNTIYTLFGTVLSQLNGKLYEKKCTYEINATVSRKC